MARKKNEVQDWICKRLEQADAEKSLLQGVIQNLMSAEADAMCGADYGKRSDGRVNCRNGYRERSWDSRVGTMLLKLPKLRQGSYFPAWLLEPRKRSEKALLNVVCESYVLGRIHAQGGAIGAGAGHGRHVEIAGFPACRRTGRAGG